MISYRLMEEAWSLYESFEGAHRPPRMMIVSPRTFKDFQDQFYDGERPAWLDAASGRIALRWNGGYIHKRRWAIDGHIMFLNRGLLILTAKVEVDKSDPLS